MALKPFMNLYDLDIGSLISKKPVFKKDPATGKFVKTGQELDYLSWPDCLLLLYRNGAERVRYGNSVSKDGHSLFLTPGGRLPEVRVWVDVDGDRQELTYPVIDGSRDIPMEKIAQSDVHNATQRAFVKCVAVNWGLGLSLWQKEEKLLPPEPREEDLSIHHIYAIKTRVEQLITARLQGGMEMADILAGVGLNQRQFDKVMASFQNIDLLERGLYAL